MAKQMLVGVAGGSKKGVYVVDDVKKFQQELRESKGGYINWSVTNTPSALARYGDKISKATFGEVGKVTPTSSSQSSSQSVTYGPIQQKSTTIKSSTQPYSTVTAPEKLSTIEKIKRKLGINKYGSTTTSIKEAGSNIFVGAGSQLGQIKEGIKEVLPATETISPYVSQALETQQKFGMGISGQIQSAGKVTQTILPSKKKEIKSSVEKTTKPIRELEQQFVEDVYTDVRERPEQLLATAALGYGVGYAGSALGKGFSTVGKLTKVSKVIPKSVAKYGFKTVATGVYGGMLIGDVFATQDPFMPDAEYNIKPLSLSQKFGRVGAKITTEFVPFMYGAERGGTKFSKDYMKYYEKYQQYKYDKAPKKLSYKQRATEDIFGLEKDPSSKQKVIRSKTQAEFQIGKGKKAKTYYREFQSETFPSPKGKSSIGVSDVYDPITGKRIRSISASKYNQVGEFSYAKIKKSGMGKDSLEIFEIKKTPTTKVKSVTTTKVKPNKNIITYGESMQKESFKPIIEKIKGDKKFTLFEEVGQVYELKTPTTLKKQPIKTKGITLFEQPIPRQPSPYKLGGSTVTKQIPKTSSKDLLSSKEIMKIIEPTLPKKIPPTKGLFNFKPISPLTLKSTSDVILNMDYDKSTKKKVQVKDNVQIFNFKDMKEQQNQTQSIKSKKTKTIMSPISGQITDIFNIKSSKKIYQPPINIPKPITSNKYETSLVTVPIFGSITPPQTSTISPPFGTFPDRIKLKFSQKKSKSQRVKRKSGYTASLGGIFSGKLIETAPKFTSGLETRFPLIRKESLSLFNLPKLKKSKKKLWG